MPLPGNSSPAALPRLAGQGLASQHAAHERSGRVNNMLTLPDEELTRRADPVPDKGIYRDLDRSRAELEWLRLFLVAAQGVQRASSATSPSRGRFRLCGWYTHAVDEGRHASRGVSVTCPDPHTTLFASVAADIVF